MLVIQAVIHAVRCCASQSRGAPPAALHLHAVLVIPACLLSAAALRSRVAELQRALGVVLEVHAIGEDNRQEHESKDQVPCNPPMACESADEQQHACRRRDSNAQPSDTRSGAAAGVWRESGRLGGSNLAVLAHQAYHGLSCVA